MAGEQSEEPGDGTPKIFKSMTGWIGGATAVVVALGGLYTAYDQLISKPKRGGKMLENGQYVWLQWPVGGGEALQSFDNQDHWEKPIRVTVEKPETTDG